MIDRIKKWLSESDFSGSTNYRVLEIILYREFVYWSTLNGSEFRDVTIKGLSRILVELGYERIRKPEGMAFIMRKREDIAREEVRGGK